jgi:hypothetical protein
VFGAEVVVPHPLGFGNGVLEHRPCGWAHRRAWGGRYGFGAASSEHGFVYRSAADSDVGVGAEVAPPVFAVLDAVSRRLGLVLGRAVGRHQRSGTPATKTSHRGE